MGSEMCIRDRDIHPQPCEQHVKLWPRELQIGGLVQAKDAEVGQHASLGGAMATQLRLRCV